MPFKDEFRGFSYVTIKTSGSLLRKCEYILIALIVLKADSGLGLSVYNNTKWRGMLLKVEEAKPDYMLK